MINAIVCHNTIEHQTTDSKGKGVEKDMKARKGEEKPKNKKEALRKASDQAQMVR